MKKNNTILLTGFLKTSEEFLNQDTDQFIQNLRFIYSAENYCLKRLPRLVNIISQSDLSSLLSDHISIAMDRLNRLEQIAKTLKITLGRTQNPTFKNICGKLGKTIQHFSTNSSKANYELISTVLEVSIYRSYIYNALLQAMNENNFPEMTKLIEQCLHEEDVFFHNLLKTKMYIKINDIKNFPIPIEGTISTTH